MTATGVDRLTVSALSKADAPDIARRQWETFGFRVVRVQSVEAVAPECVWVEPFTVTPAPSRWVVTAQVEVGR